MKLAIGSDHRGFDQKKYIIDHMPEVIWTDVGSFSAERTDYPPFAKKVVELIAQEQVDGGVLLCATGIGMAVAANRFRGIYAGVVWNQTMAQLAKEDDNVNVLVLPSDFVTHGQAVAIVQCWSQAKFKGGRYQERLTMIDTF